MWLFLHPIRMTGKFARLAKEPVQTSPGGSGPHSRRVQCVFRSSLGVNWGKNSDLIRTRPHALNSGRTYVNPAFLVRWGSWQSQVQKPELKAAFPLLGFIFYCSMFLFYWYITLREYCHKRIYILPLPTSSENASSLAVSCCSFHFSSEVLICMLVHGTEAIGSIWQSSSWLYQKNDSAMAGWSQHRFSSGLNGTLVPPYLLSLVSPTSADVSSSPLRT